MLRTDAQRHRSRRGRRYTRQLRADKRNLQRRIDNAVAALERIAGEKRRLPNAKRAAVAALDWEAQARTRDRSTDADG